MQATIHFHQRRMRDESSHGFAWYANKFLVGLFQIFRVHLGADPRGATAENLQKLLYSP